MRKDKRIYVVTFLLLLLGASNATMACPWDSDTLANEAKGLPNVVQVVTGRFERNPPLYYEMRLKRVTAELAKSPELLSHYDDAASACDRLNRDEEAIAWMEKKRIQLQKLDQTSSQVKEQWYRYYANLGTIRAHRWMRNGAGREHLEEMQQARDEIAKAIEINPNAHFGRENVQLAFMDWLIDPGEKASLPGDKIFSRMQGTKDREEAVKGLCGLIAQGNAWENVEAILAFTDSHLIREPTVLFLASLRCRELFSQGHHSVLPDLYPETTLFDLTYPGRYYLEGGVSGEVKEQYRQLRAEADEWQQRRTDYMMVRLRAGHHPDTDPAFWDEWKDTPSPSLEIPWYRYMTARIWAPNFIAAHFWVYVGTLVAIIVGLRFGTRGWRRWRAHRMEKQVAG